MTDLSAARVRALEELERGPACRSSATRARTVQFNVATDLVVQGLASFDAGRRALEITDLGRAALEIARSVEPATGRVPAADDGARE